MGCSSSAVNKAGDSSRLRGEESESCFVQPKPHALGRESTIYDGRQKESLPPLEKLKVATVSTANGVKSLHEQLPGKDDADQQGSMEKTQPLEAPKEPGPLQPGGKDDTPGVEEKRGVEAETEAQPFEGNAETAPLGTEAKHQPLRTAGESDSPAAVGDTEPPQTDREMKPLRPAEKIQPQEARGEPQLLHTGPKEAESPDTLEGSQLVETADEHQLQETPKRDEPSQLRETTPKGKGFLGMSERSQLLETAVKNDLVPKTPEGLGNMEQIQPERTVGNMEPPAGAVGTGINTAGNGSIHTNKEDQNIEGETGERVETKVEKRREGAEIKEEETGESVDLSAAT